jgi:hypothetical protein
VIEDFRRGCYVERFLGFLPGVILGRKPTFQVRFVIIHPEEGTKSSPETSVYY